MASVEPMEVVEEKFTLSATLSGHEQDVRAVSCTADGAVLTASRDHSVRVWRRASADGPFEAPSTLTGHTHFVIAACATPNGAASGSNDKHVIEWDLQTAVPLRVLDGHTNTVSCVVYSAVHGLLYSASWDKTVKVWKEGECLRTLEGHEATVWSVLPVDDADGRVLSASGDRTIKLWKETACEVTYSGHEDVVRSLALVSGIGFVSASNDGTVRLWELSGACLHILSASQSFIYDVKILPSGEWMTASEDRTIKVWQAGGGECVQAMTHPSSVWSCAALPNGDVVAGCADANAYVWTRAAGRAAPEEVQLQFKETVSSVAMPAQQAEGQLGELGSMVKGEDALLTPGTKEGEHLIVKAGEAATPILYQWSTATAAWEKVGEVTGSAGGGGDGGGAATLGKRLYEGKEYDYLFDIDINGAPLKLPFNRGDDPWMAAQQWMWKHGIDQMHLDSIAKHLIDNTPGNVPQVSGGNVDPFTSGGAYRPNAPAPSGGGGFGGGGGGNVDPFTSGGAYRPGQPHPSSATSGGGGRHPAPSASAGPPAYITFDACKHDAVLAKLTQFNEQAGAAALDGAAAERLRHVVAALKAAGDAPPMAAEDVALFTSAGGLLSWPLALLFPCVDLLRLVLLRPSAAAVARDHDPPLLPVILGRLSEALAAPADDKVAAAAAQMLLRCLANMASRAELRAVIAASASPLVDALAAPISSGAAGARLAACTVLHNLAFSLSKGVGVPTDSALKSRAWALQALSLLTHALANVAALSLPAEEDSLVRLLLSADFVLRSSPAAKEAAKEADLPAALSAFTLPASASPRAGSALQAARAHFG